MKTVLIPVNQGFAARFILHTDVLPTLLEGGAKVLLAVPQENTYFEEFSRSPQIQLVPYRMSECHSFRNRSSIERRIHALRPFVLSSAGDLQSVDDKFRMYLSENRKQLPGLRGKIKRTGARLAVKALRSSRMLRHLLLWVEETFFAPPIHADIFDTHRPDLLLTTSLGIFDFDEYWMREARKRGIKVLTLVQSWDNTSSKGLRGANPDVAVAWTEAMRKELEILNDISASKIRVGGPAHFDFYFRESSYMLRDELFERIGADPSKKLILYASRSPNTYPWNAEICEIILDAISRGELGTPANLVARLHPIYFRMAKGAYQFQSQIREMHELKSKSKDFILNEPTLLAKTLNYSMPREEIRLLSSLLKHSDVVINLFSTINIEGALVGRPLVNVAFEGTRSSEPKRARHSIGLDERQVHNKRIIATGGISLARNSDELIACIREYLRDPSLHAEGRRRIVQNEAGPEPGKSGARIGKIVLEELGARKELR